MKSLIIISTPAGGKGSISDYLESKYNFSHISSGDLLREEVSNKTEIGKTIEEKLQKGELVSEEILFTVLKKKLENQKGNYILDGTPRELHQAIVYDEILDELNIELSKVIYLKVDKEIAINRMLDRGVCESCNKSDSISKNNGICSCGGNLVRRNDDNIDTFSNRYETFETKTMPLLDYYKGKNKDLVVTVTNNTLLEDAYKQIDKIMETI